MTDMCWKLPPSPVLGYQVLQLSQENLITGQITFLGNWCPFYFLKLIILWNFSNSLSLYIFFKNTTEAGCSLISKFKNLKIKFKKKKLDLEVILFEKWNKRLLPNTGKQHIHQPKCQNPSFSGFCSTPRVGS